MSPYVFVAVHARWTCRNIAWICWIHKIALPHVANRHTKAGGDAGIPVNMSLAITYRFVFIGFYRGDEFACARRAAGCITIESSRTGRI